MPKLTKKERKEIFRAVSLMTQIAFVMVACVLIGVLIGRFLDNNFETSPLFVLLFSFFGAGAAFKSLYDLSKRF